MALIRSIGGAALSEALTLKSGEVTPLGAITISEGLDSYKYIYACRLQGSASDVTVRDDAFMSISDFITAGSIVLGTSSTCTATYTDNNTLTVSQSTSTQEMFIVLFK